MTTFTRDIYDDGGATYRAADLTRVSPTRGYAVGIGSDSIAWPASESVLSTMLAWAVDAYRTDYVGTWVEDGRVYIDAVVIVASLESAMTIARRHGQLAIYDFANSTVIHVVHI
jgi:hypothetical protein